MSSECAALGWRPNQVVIEVSIVEGGEETVCLHPEGIGGCTSALAACWEVGV